MFLLLFTSVTRIENGKKHVQALRQTTSIRLWWIPRFIWALLNEVANFLDAFNHRHNGGRRTPFVQSPHVAIMPVYGSTQSSNVNGPHSRRNEQPRIVLYCRILRCKWQEGYSDAVSQATGSCGGPLRTGFEYGGDRQGKVKNRGTTKNKEI